MAESEFTSKLHPRLLSTRHELQGWLLAEKQSQDAECGWLIALSFERKTENMLKPKEEDNFYV